MGADVVLGSWFPSKHSFETTSSARIRRIVCNYNIYTLTQSIVFFKQPYGFNVGRHHTQTGGVYLVFIQRYRDGTDNNQHTDCYYQLYERESPALISKPGAVKFGHEDNLLLLYYQPTLLTLFSFRP